MSIAACVGDPQPPAGLRPPRAPPNSIRDDTGEPEHLWSWYADTDADGYGAPAVVVESSEAPEGYVADATDCDDTDPSIHPGADEVCNETDEDCDGTVDEDVQSTWYADMDGDGWGDEASPAEACEAPTSHVELPGDCDDGDPTISPAGVEICDDGVDSDCSGFDLRCRLEGEVDLSDADVKYLAGTTGDMGGSSVQCGGDTDGDGQPDLLIGESQQFLDDFTSELRIGVAWLVTDITEGEHDLDSTGIGLWGASEDDYSQGEAYFVEDVNADGYDEVITTNHSAYPFLAYGPITSDIVPSEADVVFSQPHDGINLGGVVDLGEEQFALGHYGDLYLDGEWGYHVGAVYILEGPLSEATSTDDAVSTITPDVDHEYSSFSSTMCSGDLDGDGAEDLVVGSAGRLYVSSVFSFVAYGNAYVLYGPFSGDLRVAERDGTLLDAAARIEGNESIANVSSALSCAGDTNGDGLDDLLVSGPGSGDYEVEVPGQAGLFLGPVSGTLEMVEANAVVTSDMTDVHYVGAWATLDADLDGDSNYDLAVSSYFDSDLGVTDYDDEVPSTAVFYGPVTGRLLVESSDASITAEVPRGGPGDLAACPDVDGDGFDDLLVGAPGESSIATWNGAAYILFGGGGG